MAQEKVKYIKRLNLDLGPQAYEALSSIQETMDNGTQSAAIRLALLTVHRLVDELKAGGKVKVVNAKGEERELFIPELLTDSTREES
jgi:hypothetical protein